MLITLWMGVALAEDDTTPPAFDNDSPRAGIAVADGARAVQVVFETQDGEQVYYYLVLLPEGADPPTKEQIKNGQDANDSPALAFRTNWGGSKTSNSSMKISAPQHNTPYDIYMVLGDDAGNLSEPEKVDATTPPSADFFAAGYPKMGAVQAPASKTIEVLVTIQVPNNSYGIVHYVLVEQGDDAPSIDQIIDGKDSAGNNALDYGNTDCIINNSEKEFLVTGDADGTVYDLYLVAQDTGSGDRPCTEAVKLEVTTPPATATQLAAPTGLDWDDLTPGKAKWDAVANASSYSVQLYKDGVAHLDAVTGITAAEYDFTAAITAAGSGSYTYKVTAIGDGASYTDSPQSDASDSYDYSAAPAPPGPIESFSCSNIENTSAAFTWPQVTGATAIKIQYSLDNANNWQDATHDPINTSATTATVTGLTQSTAYIFRLVVTDGDNEGNSNLVFVSTAPRSTVSGTVKNSSGNLISGATVSFFDGFGGNMIGEVQSGIDGSYSISNVPVGNDLNIQAKKQYYLLKSLENVVVTEDPANTVDIELEKILADGYPKVGDAQADGSKKIEILLQANDTADAYFVVLPNDASQPSEQQIKDGKDSTGTAAIYAGGGALAADTEQGFLTGELTADAAAYDIYVVLVKGFNWSEVVKLDVTTPPAAQVGPTITSAVMDAENDFLTITFSEPVYGDALHSTGINKDDFAIALNRNDGVVSGASIRNVTNTGYVSPAGGETQFILQLNLVDGPPTGAETITVNPVANSIFNFDGTASSDTQTTGPINLNALPPITFDAGYPKAGAVQPDGSHKVEVLYKLTSTASDAYIIWVVLPDGATEPTAQQIKDVPFMMGSPVIGADPVLVWANHGVSIGDEAAFTISTNLADDTDYDVYLLVEAGNNNFSPVGKVEVRTPPAIVVAPPGPILSFACTTTDNSTAAFKWSQATEATNIKVQYSLDNANTWLDATHGAIDPLATTATVTGLAPSTAYIFKLVVTGGSNAGDSNLAYGSTAPWGSISGTVKDAGGNPIENASISLFAGSGGGHNGIADSVSAADGSYSIAGVPAGEWRYAYAARQHYIVVNTYDIEVTEGNTTTVNFVMEKILADGYPKPGTAQADGSKLVKFLVVANGDSTTAYYVVLPDTSPQPSEQQIKDGKDSTGAAAIYAGGGALAENIEQGFTTAALPADNTAYDVFVVLQRGAYWSEVVKLDMTTPAANVLALSTVNPPHGQVGAVYTGHDFTSNTTGGTAPYTYSYTGNLPAGLTLSEAGVLSGTPTASANVELVVTVEDALGVTAQQTYYFNIVPADLFINGGTLNAATQGVPYEYQLATVTGGGTLPYIWSVSSGALPNGITLNSTTGYLTGTPTATGTYNFEVTVTDSETPTAKTAAASFTLPVNAPVPVSSITVSGAGGAAEMADRLAEGELQMIATVLPANATNKNVTWSVAPKGPAWSEVSPGQIGAGLAEITTDGLLYRGHTVGLVTVRATAQDGSEVYGESDITIAGVRMSYGGVGMIVDGTNQLTAQAVPADTTEFNWVSSNPNVATVSNNGLVTAVGPGTADITATTANGRVGHCSVTVAVKPPATMANLTISKGTLTPAFDPDIYEYTATVANSIKSVTISATKWGDMDVSGDIGAFDLAVGANTFEVDVDGGAGHIDSTYTIVITRQSSGGGGGGGGGILTGYPIYTTGSTLEKYNTVFDIPRGAVTKDTRGDIGRLDNGRIDAPADSVIQGYIYEFTKKASGDFLKPVTVVLPFDEPAADPDKYTLSIFRFDEDLDQWVELDNVDVNESDVSGETKKTGCFAVIATEKPSVPPVEPRVDQVEPEPVVLADITGHWAETAIRSLVSTGAVSGYPDGTFRPDNSITRAEFATVLAKGFKLPAGQGKVFEDTAGHWAKDYIAAVYAAGIIEGYSQQQFGPDDMITREQMAIMIVKASKLQAASGQLNYADSSDVSAWAYGWVVSAINNQLMNGYQDNTFRPQAKATKAEAMTVIYNALHSALQ